MTDGQSHSETSISRREVPIADLGALLPVMNRREAASGHSSSIRRTAWSNQYQDPNDFIDLFAQKLKPKRKAGTAVKWDKVDEWSDRFGRGFGGWARLLIEYICYFSWTLFWLSDQRNIPLTIWMSSTVLALPLAQIYIYTHRALMALSKRHEQWLVNRNCMNYRRILTKDTDFLYFCSS